MRIIALDPQPRSSAALVTQPRRILYVGAQAPAAVDGTVPPGFAAQCRLAWANVFGVLGEAGMTVRNLAKITVYLADRRFRETNALIAEEILGGHCPARTVVIAGTDDEAWLLAIEAVAYG